MLLTMATILSVFSNMLDRMRKGFKVVAKR